ncbi:MAG: NUDIX domain-containing protein [Candidatus Magasanikbacteria bacterium]|uniref:Nudix hydrolase domain-containing protein n=1 Tax=Candidatus Magasanikbacteria bacterium CG10_big_fil_rev_8_21_14_0_10_38_6 TaxID=1974647 RepID=A0A2M6P279_9BACT|nr:NUDIX domain-containing protein [Candidatus Magasanikbacteria bacterium]NCS72213.1 NUDIX domain-containing protein [Candidatus Magasanikbacteria bacterium]PIR77659.1 MAG: hypothetical protein COU30_01250 [Candidatus Magasanikbacteria bacterium CG10_big_fil_rev_8_21_14_0_10_38_6]
MRTDRPTILIATTNEGKLKEILYKLQTQDVQFISLNDLPETIEEPVEDGGSLVANALIKATYYAQKSGYITIADDTGLFVHELNGWPGIEVGRFLRSDDEHFNNFLKKMEPTHDRSASFKCALVIHDPERSSSFISEGTLHGEILTEPTEKTGQNDWGYNRLFYIKEKQKSYGQLSLAEKSEISHRGNALHNIKYYIANQYGSKQLIVPAALIIQEGKILMNLRNDPKNPHTHNKWEFPGGGVDFGENTRQSVVREAKEETGLDIEIIELLPHIQTEEWTRQNGKLHYQLHILPYVCKVIGGTPHTNDEEVLASKWYDIEDVHNHDLVGNNQALWKEIKPTLQQIIKKHSL